MFLEKNVDNSNCDRAMPKPSKISKITYSYKHDSNVSPLKGKSLFFKQ